ncbi:MAG: alpha-rhamnosidase, partial [Prevotellaceae bacterium]|nr:alpha-rhamnosidase [Prevotellaceae bacterium]
MKKILFTAASLALSLGYAFAADGIAVENLRCEYLVNPLGIDRAQPRLSWELSSGQSGKSQKAYQILVATDAAALAGDKADTWDSKKTTGNVTNQIVYKGKPLQP